MQLPILAILMTFSIITSVFAAPTSEPVGYQNMLNSLASVSSPSEANGKEFRLTKPNGLESFTLTLNPANVFEVRNLNDGSIYISISNAQFLYDMELYDNTSILTLNKVGFEWKVAGDGIVNNGGGGFQSCSLNVGFTLNNTVVTKSTLDYFNKNNYNVNLEFDDSIVEQIGSTETEYIFKRKNNTDTGVNLTITKPDGSLLGRASVANLAKCDQKSNTSSSSTTSSTTSRSEWSQWTEWNSCSSSCGEGKQSHTRTCLTENTAPCSGNQYEERTCNIRACSTSSMTDSQKRQLKMNGVALNIINTSGPGLLRSTGIAFYEAALSNPFSRTIRCDISITSSRGVNRDYQTIDHKSHIAVTVAPLGVVKTLGRINIMKGRNDTGMSWADGLYRGNTYYAENCTFLD